MNTEPPTPEAAPAQPRSLRKIGLLTSGGDAPGMNACTRAIVRTAIYHDLEVVGFRHGFRGVLEKDFMPMNARSVSNIIQRGGTIIGSARCPEFKEAAARDLAACNLEELGIDALLINGGDGSLHGAKALADHWDGQIIGQPGTIDNDLAGSDWTIGFFTALDTALNAIDKIRDTAEAFDRVFLVEVMGRMAGWIGAGVGLAGGVEEILLPEFPVDYDAIAERLERGRERGKGSCIMVVSEGVPGKAHGVADEIEKRTGISTRTCVLGHIQRGGSPRAFDRIIATKLGAFSVEAALAGHTGVMAGEVNGERVLTPFAETWKGKKPLDPYFLNINRYLTI